MKIGLFFGSFNPIHCGHVEIARFFINKTDLEQLCFVVSPQNPLKERGDLLDIKDRLAMVALSVEDDARFQVSDVECQLPIPSYTIDTLDFLANKYPQHDFVLLLGGDNLDVFEKWKSYERLLDTYKIYVYPRQNTKQSDWLKHPNVSVFQAPLYKISSTEIRAQRKNEEFLRENMLPKAAEYFLKLAEKDV